MKNKYLFLLTTIFVLLLSSSVFGATKADILAELKTPITVNGQSKSVPGAYVKMAADFLNSNDLTEEQLDSIISQVRAAKSLVISTGELSYSNMSDDVKNQLQGMVSNAVATADAGVSINDESFTITSKETNRTYTSGTKTDSPIKKTGGHYYFNILNYIVIANFFVTIIAVLTIKKFNILKEF